MAKVAAPNREDGANKVAYKFMYDPPIGFERYCVACVETATVGVGIRPNLGDDAPSPYASKSFDKSEGIPYRLNLTKDRNFA